MTDRAAEPSADSGLLPATHIRLVCWDQHHVQAWSPDQLRQIVCAPICTAMTSEDTLCGSPIWAVEHDGEPTRYVGKAPHRNWHRWAECIGSPGASSDGGENAV